MRSTLCLAVCAIFSIIAIVSCQKEFSIDLFDATASLKDSSGNCLPIVVKGNYQKDTLLTAENYIEANVNVASTGSYFIQTETVNGFSFSGQGQFERTGLQTIRLTATGTPAATGNFDFMINYGGNSCPVTILVADGAAGAKYSLTNGSGDCPVVEAKGIYMQNVPVDRSNYISFAAHVTKAGVYTIGTETENGISFEGSGTFTDTGMQHIVLKASGTPITEGDYDISFTGDNANCSFALNVKPENNDPAVYTIDCMVTQLNGDYIAAIPVGSANKAIIYATVTTPGKYNITTPTVNGIGFSASGTFTAASMSPIPVTLKATGTPVVRGDFDYPVTASSNSCSFKVSFTGPAEFTLAGSPGACAAAIVNGTYNKGSVLGNANTVVIKANVTATGPYKVSTNTVNGFSFTATGTFTATGQQDITLTATGTPAAAGVFSFSPQVSGSGCSFDITVGETPADAGIFTCKIDGVFTAFNDRAVASIKELLTPNTLSFEGYTAPPNGAYVPELKFYINYLDGSPVKAGSYNVDGLLTQGYQIEIDYMEVFPDMSVVRWNTASSFFSPNPPFTVNITSITETRVKGTFSGEITNLFEGSTKRKKVTEGKFDLPIVE